MPREKYFFINPPSKKGRKLIRNFDCATESKGNYLYQPYDFLLLSAQLEEYEFELVDAIAENLSENTIFSKCDNAKMFVVALADTNWEEDFEFVKNLRKLFPETPILVFGDSFIEKNARDEIESYVNGILANPIEVNLKNLDLKNGYVDSSTYNRSNLKQAVKISIDLPKHRKFLLKKYGWPFSRYKEYTTVFTAWGCPYSCSYCVVAKFPNMYRDYREVIGELENLKEIGIKEVYIGDRSFGLPRENVIALMKEMIKRDLRFSWSTYFHPNQYDEELLDLMKKSGCHTIIIGIETYNFKSLKKYGRHLKIERFNKLIDHAKKIKMQVCGDFIIGLPNETKSDIEKTIRLSKKLGIDYASFNIAAPLAGSSLRHDAIEDGRIKMGDEKHFDSFGYSKVLPNGALSEKEILALRNKAVRQFYFRPSYLIRRLLSITSFEHFLIQAKEMVSIAKKTNDL